MSLGELVLHVRQIARLAPDHSGTGTQRRQECGKLARGRIGLAALDLNLVDEIS